MKNLITTVAALATLAFTDSSYSYCLYIQTCCLSVCVQVLRLSYITIRRGK